MKDRIKQVRKNAGLNQYDFGEKLGVTQPTIAGYETGKRTPIDAIIKSICDKFDVNEEWLRTGEGEMYIEKTKEEEIADLVSKFFEDPDPRKRDVVRWFLELDDDELKMLENFARALLGKK